MCSAETAAEGTESTEGRSTHDTGYSLAQPWFAKVEDQPYMQPRCFEVGQYLSPKALVEFRYGLEFYDNVSLNHGNNRILPAWPELANPNAWAYSSSGKRWVMTWVASNRPEAMMSII